VGGSADELAARWLAGDDALVATEDCRKDS
jgi:hypothetical protein